VITLSKIFRKFKNECCCVDCLHLHRYTYKPNPYRIPYMCSVVSRTPGPMHIEHTYKWRKCERFTKQTLTERAKKELLEI
jgi:hypothetical protein